MRPQVLPLPLTESPLAAVAAELCRRLPGAPAGDFTAALVLLPSTRACRTLGQLLFERSGLPAVLLPRILTPAQLATEAVTALGLQPPARPPAAANRALILSHELVARGWLQGPSETAPGLAQELVRAFDEIRRQRLADLLLGPAPLEAALARMAVRAAEAEATAAELRSLREAWRLYRDNVPHDEVDTLVSLAARLETPAGGDAPARWPAPAPALAVAAGFTRLDPVTAAPMRAALAAAATSLVVVPAGDDALTRRLLATWDPRDERGGPLGPARRAAALLGADPAAGGGAAVDDARAPADATIPALRERLVELDEQLPPLPKPGPGAALQCLACGTAEHEAAVIADVVVRRLQEPDGAVARVAVAVPDRKLAARVSARLRDAGLDVDNTHGEPLSAQPAGLLLRFALRAALTGLRGEAVLELLAHPYVALPAPGGNHGLWTLRLERLLRSDEAFQGGQASLLLRAREHDEAARAVLRRAADGMEAFVAAIGEALAPLLAAGARPTAPWAEHLTALRRCWAALAPEQPLGRNAERADVIAAARLLDELEADAGLLPPVTSADFAADLGRALAAALAPPHRDPGLGLLVTGHLEARLERFDLLVVGGLADGALPRRPARPAFLGARAREALGLPGRRDSLDADAELFLRLLHGAPRVVLTWPGEDDRAPVLPSPLVERLLLVHGLAATDASLLAGRPAAWSARPAAGREAAVAAQRAFLSEPQPAPLLAPARPVERLSWSSLKQWRECPYAFLLERRFALRRDEDVRREFGRREYGQRAHDALRRFLEPGTPGHAALAAGDRGGALAAFAMAVNAAFGPGDARQPDRALWREAFLQLGEPVVAHELDRFAIWRPVGFEVPFELPLARLLEWLRTDLESAADDEALALLATLPAELPAAAAAVVLEGSIDRLDAGAAGAPRLAVLDFKTGDLHAKKEVARGEELQVLLYAAAVAAGAELVPGGGGALPAGAGIAEGAYYALAPGAVIGARVDLPALDGEGRPLLREGAARLVRLACEAAAPDGPFPLVPRAAGGERLSRLPCDRCDWRGVCRLEEADLPAPLRRRVETLVNQKEDQW